MRTSKFGLLAIAGCLALVRPAVAEEITVRVASGRVFVGEVDARTDNAVLWLRATRGGARVRRPISWRRIVSAQVADRELSAEELQKAAAGLIVAAEPAPSVDQPVTFTPPMPAEAIDASAATSPSAPAAAPQQLVTAVQIEAALGHWGANVETDGIVVDVYPTDIEGRLVPVDGTLALELVGAPAVSWRATDRLARWTVSVRKADFIRGPARVRVPFLAVHPEFETHLKPIGLMHARLSVPGQGVFEASDAQVRIRPYSGFRDRLQQQAGTRFLDLERTGRGNR